MMTIEEQRADAEARARDAKAEHEAKWAAGVRAEQEDQRRVADAARNPSRTEQLAAEARRGLMEATARAGRVDPADLDARLVAADEVARAARTAFDIIDVRARAAKVTALGQAGSDPVARAKAVAKAQSDWASAVGQAEADAEAACLAADRAAVAAHQARAVAAHRIRAAEARLAERAKEERDPLRLSNPFADPIKPVITVSQFESIRDPALKARAANEARVVPDDDPPFTAEDVKNVLRSRGSGNRLVLARADFAALSPADQAEAAKSAIIV